ncbi:MAG: DUF1385 domain-containing protein [Bacillota bacterium]|jgi:uncharacterized protein YqhQ
MSRASYGGQAVIEGIVMNGPGGKAIACRTADGEIVYKKEIKRPLKEKYPVLGWPIIRGFVSFIYSLVVGMQDIAWSAAQAGEEEEQLSTKDIVFAIILACAMAIGLFVVLPVFIGNFAWAAGGDFARSLTEGLFRGGIFFAYILLISRMSDVQRLFAYHGAEHKTINAVEAGEILTPQNVSKYSRIHTRCGTSFILMSMILMIVIFTFVGQTDTLHRIFIKLAVMPLVAGGAYELFRLPLFCPHNPLVKALVAPGLWMQRLTTKEPDEKQLEVAIAAMVAVPGFAEENGELIVKKALPESGQPSIEETAEDLTAKTPEEIIEQAKSDLLEAQKIVEPPPVDTLANTLMDILADIPAKEPLNNNLLNDEETAINLYPEDKEQCE